MNDSSIKIQFREINYNQSSRLTYDNQAIPNITTVNTSKFTSNISRTSSKSSTINENNITNNLDEKDLKDYVQFYVNDVHSDKELVNSSDEEKIEERKESNHSEIKGSKSQHRKGSKNERKKSKSERKGSKCERRISNFERRVSKTVIKSSDALWRSILLTLKGYLKFVGPGFMISVAYIDPGNYSVDIKAGGNFRFRLLYIGLISNLFAIFFQGLCVKLGSVTGFNLAEACRAFLPRWLNLCLYVIAEISMIATDMTEVVGTGIAVNLLIPKIPLEVGCALSILDVIFIRVVSTPDGKLKGLRAFEFFVMTLVMGVVICFCIQLCLIQTPSVGEVLCGYLPSKDLFESQGLYRSCCILGSTVMPHSLYLGSGLIQPRLKKYDIDNGIMAALPGSNHDDKNKVYKPSLEAINSCTKVFTTELIICLFVFALFVNSAILITAGASLYGTSSDDADLFGIHDLLSNSLAPAAGVIFAFALLISGGSAAIVCTLAGQMISAGALHVTLRPWMRRLISRSISITPSIIVAALAGRDGLDDVLDASQVALSLMLPFITAPLLVFTSMDRYMTVRTPRSYERRMSNRTGSVSWDVEALPPTETKMGNHWATTVTGVIIWLIIVSMNLGNILGKITLSLKDESGDSILMN